MTNTVSDHSADLPDVGDLVAGRYRIDHEVGRGGYGVVYGAYQEAISRRVAIKFLLPDVAQDPTEVERFRREIFHASGLEHPHTVTLYDYGRSPAGLLYVVMEYLEGMTLEGRISENNPVPPDVLRVLLEQVLGSLDEAHRRDLVHRDIKPDNIFLRSTSTGDLDARVLDFGLSKFIGDPDSTHYRGPSLTEEGEICGTPHYMSPEHAYGEKVGPSGDIYSLGLVVHEALTGKPAFTGNAPLDILLKQVQEPVPPLPSDVADTPVAEFVERATPKESDERFEDAGQALEWLIRQPAADLDDANRSGAVRTILSDTSPEQSTADTPDVGPKDDTEPTPAPDPDMSPAAPEVDEPVEETSTAPDITSRRAALERFELRVAQAGLVGRQRTISRLEDWLDHTLHSGGIFVLTGDAGAGKTAVIDNWHNRLATRRDLVVFRGEHPPDASPLTGLETVFRPLFDSASNASPKLSAPQSQHLRQLFDTSELVDPESDRSVRTIIHGLSDTLDALGDNTPVVLLFDDLHRADPLTRQFFDYLLDSMADRRRSLAVVVTARTEETTRTWKRIENAPTVHWRLPRLETDDLEELLDRLLPVAESLGQEILRLTSGNPALLLHICRYLLEGGDLVDYDDDRDCWVLSDPSVSVEELVPQDLQELVVERANRYLRRADDEAALRAILHRAVLLGDEFDAALLKQVLLKEGRDELARRSSALLDELTSSGLLVAHSDYRNHRFAFARPLHRASLVRMVESIDDWRRFHRLVAKALVDRIDDEPDLAVATIAEHLERADRPDEALAWWLRAARRAEAEHRYRDALQRVHRALRLAGGPATDVELMTSLRLRQGRLSRQIGELGPAEDALRAAIEAARQSHQTDLRARATELLADVVMIQGRLDEATELIDTIDDLYDVIEDRAGHQRTVLTRAQLAIFRGKYRRANELFERLGGSPDTRTSSELRARALVGRTRCLYAAGDLDQARIMATEARNCADILGDSRSEIAAIVEAAHIALITAGVESSESLAHQALTFARREHDLLGQANAHLALGITLRRSTNIDRALFHARRARELHESLGHFYGILKDILLNAELAWAQGVPERALILAEDASDLHRDLGDRHGWALSTLFRSLFLLELDRADDARQLLDEVREIEDRDALGLYEPHWLLFQGLAAQDSGEVDSAIEHFRKGRQRAGESGNREMVSRNAYFEAQLLMAVGELESARELMAVALSEARNLGHAPATMLALLGSALLARLDADPDRLQESMTRLRTYLVTPHAPELQLPVRLRHLRRLVDHQPENPYRTDLLEAIDELQRDLPDKTS